MRFSPSPARLDPPGREEHSQPSHDEALDRLTRLASESLGAPMALITLVDRGDQPLAIHTDRAEAARVPAASLDCALARHIVDSRRPLLVDDLRMDARLRD